MRKQCQRVRKIQRRLGLRRSLISGHVACLIHWAVFCACSNLSIPRSPQVSVIVEFGHTVPLNLPQDCTQATLRDVRDTSAKALELLQALPLSD